MTRQPVWVVLFLLPVLGLWLLFAHLQWTYNVFLDLAEIGILLSVVAAPFTLNRRCRPACATVWILSGGLCALTSYLAAMVLYVDRNGSFNLLAWCFTAGLWPIVYSAGASLFQAGHMFLVAVVLPFGLALGLWLAASAAVHNRPGSD